MSSSPSVPVPVRLTVNRLIEPTGVGATCEFGWMLYGQPGAEQCAYEVEVGACVSGWTLEDPPLWATGRVAGNAQFGIAYTGPSLLSGQEYRWRVRVADAEGMWSPWSEPSRFETGLLTTQDWAADWVGHDADNDHSPIYLRGALDIPAGAAHQIVRARAYVSALGWYRFFVNGRDLTGTALVPRFTPFDDEIEYQSYDLGGLLGDGTNVLGMVIADGRFRGALGMHNRQAVYGARLAGIVQIVLECADGTIIRHGTDATWRGGRGQILFADPKFGETIDLRQPTDLLSARNAPTGFTPVTVRDESSRVLVSSMLPPVAEADRLHATVSPTQDGQLLDFGQNFAGVIRLRLSGPVGTKVILQHAEDLRADGTLDWKHLDRAGEKDTKREQRFQRDEIILGGEDEWVQPSFTIHGFRYVEVTGLDHPLTSDDVEGVVLSSATPLLGSFSCSDARLDKLYRNAYWSLRSNFTDTATDCPTRERGGFTGDAQVFAATAAAFTDTQLFFRRYLRSLSLEQFSDGSIPMIVPAEVSTHSGGASKRDRRLAQSVGWGDAAVLVPWTLYERYGDLRVLSDQFDSMRRWVDFLITNARKGGPMKLRYLRLGAVSRHIVDHGFLWGEWLRAGEKYMAGMMRDMFVNRGNIATAYLSHSSRLLSRSAETLGRNPEAAHYRAIADATRAAWQRAFLRRDGRIGTNRQDDYVRALAFDLVPEQQKELVVDRLVALIESAGDHLGTGFLSTAMILPVLAQHRRGDVAYRLLLQTSSPSWLADIDSATTIRENWKEFADNGDRVGSSNHYAFGSVANWMVTGIAGITPAAPGYRRVLFRPHIGGGLTHATAAVPTPFGTVGASWRITDSTVTYTVELPLGTTGTVISPDGRTHEIGPGAQEIRWTNP